MATPFTDFVIADVGFALWAGLLTATIMVTTFLYALEPPVTQKMVIAFIPWMISGSVLHVFWQLQESVQDQLYPEMISGLFSAPAVYLTTFIPLAVIWSLSAMFATSYDKSDRIALQVGIIGAGVMTPLLGLIIWQGMGDAVGPMEPIWPVIGLITSFVGAFVLYVVIGSWRTYVIADARLAGGFVLFAHVFDAVTTAIGVEQLGATERSAVPRAILEFAADLPTADALGTAWLFVLVKVVLASVIVIVFADYVREKPTQGNLMFAIIGAVGLGPAVNNFLLFLLAI